MATPQLKSYLNNGYYKPLVGREEMNTYLNKYYQGGASDPLNMRSQAPTTGGGNSNLGSAIAGGITGAAQIGGDIYAANEAPKSIQTQSPQVQPIDQYGTPTYNLGSQASYIKGLNRNDYGRGLGMQGFTTGAGVGAQIGGLPGAVIGGALGFGAGLLGRRSARKKAERQINLSKRNFGRAQQDFNDANLLGTKNRLAQQQYQDMLDPYNVNRIYG